MCVLKITFFELKTIGLVLLWGLEADVELEADAVAVGAGVVAVGEAPHVVDA